MGLFQALLLAASLGWTAAVAQPYGQSSSADNASISQTYIPPTPKTRFPHTESTARSLSAPVRPVTSASGTMTLYAPVTMYSQPSLDAPPSASPVSLISDKSLEGPGGSPNQQHKATGMPGQQHTTVDAGSSPSKTGGTWHQAGGDNSPTTTAPAEAHVTYYVHGTPILAGASATVIAGTTYSIASSGGRVWVDGKSTAATGVASTAHALASSSPTPVLAMGGAGVLEVPGALLGVIGGLLAVV